MDSTSSLCAMVKYVLKLVQNFSAVGFSFANFTMVVKHAYGKNNISCCVDNLNRGERGVTGGSELNSVLDLVKECFDG